VAWRWVKSTIIGGGVILDARSLGAAMTGDKRDVEAYVRALASEHGVTLEQDAYAKMAQVLTNLGGDDVQLDQVEQLLVGLKRKSVIDGKEMLLLQAEYLRSKSS
jgi:hypothetical protein